MMKTRSNSKVKPFTSLKQALEHGLSSYILNAFLFKTYTTNFFEATTTTEALACLFWLPVGVLFPDKGDPVGLASDGRLVTGRLAGLFGTANYYGRMPSPRDYQ